MTVEFNQVLVGSTFLSNSTQYVKVSSRTGRMVGSTLWFYFGLRDRCKV